MGSKVMGAHPGRGQNNPVFLRHIAPDAFFGFFSEAGTWSAAEVAAWFHEAGLEAQKPRSPWMMSGLALHVGRKPA